MIGNGHLDMKAAALGAIIGTAIVGTTMPASAACDRASFGRWAADCSGAFTYVEANMDGASTSDRLVLWRNDAGVRLVATIPLSYYRRFFTNTPPAVIHFEQPYVVDALYFCGRDGPVLKIGDVETSMEADPAKSVSGEPFERDGASQYRVPAAATEKVLKAMAGTTKAELRHCQRGHGSGFVSVFDLTGYREADAARAGKRP